MNNRKGFMTIGYGNMGIIDFMVKIKSLRVNCIIDVRTRPYSKYNVSFNKEELRDRLNDEGISYFWFGNKLGGKYDLIKYCDLEGRVDYEKVSTSEKFIDGIKELEKLIPRYNICIMCSEKDPMKCHRFLLISRILKEYNIYHIMSNDSLVKNVDLEKKLLEMYGRFNQISMFDYENMESLETKAYRAQSQKTAYVSEKVRELLSKGITEDVPEKINIYCIGTENKTAVEFFNLLKEYKVKRIIDVRDYVTKDKVAFATYPDIAYYLKLNLISYEIVHTLVASDRCIKIREHNSLAGYLETYREQINRNNGLLSLLTDELDGTCFLGYDEDYRNCHRHIVIKELKKRCSNIRVRHLK